MLLVQGEMIEHKAKGCQKNSTHLAGRDQAPQQAAADAITQPCCNGKRANVKILGTSIGRSIKICTAQLQPDMNKGSTGTGTELTPECSRCILNLLQSLQRRRVGLDPPLGHIFIQNDMRRIPG
jgi:hypothetical protein